MAPLAVGGRAYLHVKGEYEVCGHDDSLSAYTSSCIEADQEHASHYELDNSSLVTRLVPLPYQTGRPNIMGPHYGHALAPADTSVPLPAAE